VNYGRIDAGKARTFKTLNKKDHISDELIRQQPDLPDLEKEKMMRRFAYDEE